MGPAEIRRVHPLVRWLSLLYLIPKREWLRRRVERTVVEEIRDLSLAVPLDVFNPVIFRTGSFFTEFIADSDYCDPVRFVRNPTPRALDCTTGPGAQAIMLARRGFQVMAVDINPRAVDAARSNVLRNQVEDRVQVVHGDLFEPVAGQTFDIVVSHLPSFRGEPVDHFDLSWRSPDIIERFARGLSRVLSPDGFGLASFTTDGDQEGFFRALDENALEVRSVADKHLGNEIVSIYHLRQNRDE